MKTRRKIAGKLKTSFTISLIFTCVLIVYLISMFHYWQGELQPRLRQAAATQADIISQSQMGLLANALQTVETDKRQRAVQQIIEEILLVTDPSIGEPLIIGLALEVDYDTVPVDAESLDISEGTLSCDDCFVTQVAVMANTGELLAIATLNVTGAYYRLLSSDIKSKLINQLIITLLLFFSVWVGMMILVTRLDKLKQNIEISDRAKTRFLANVSHELRTPLNAILGYTQLFNKDKTLMGSHGRGIDTIHRSADHLLLLINDILDFSKVDSKGIQLCPSEIILSDFLKTLVEMTEVRATIKDIGFVHEFADQLPEVVVVDDKRLRQILLNLLNNAVKFTPEGQVTFTVEVLSQNHPKDRQLASETVLLRFSVKDTGIGIAQDQLADIFVPYQQIDNQITRAEGSGLGLTISKNLVDLMGQTLYVQSQSEVGSQFWFDLPLPVSNQTVPLVDESQYGCEHISGFEGPSKTILSIDDNHFNRDVIRQYLTRYGFDVVEASGGQQGLQLLNKNQPDLVLLDVLMPDMDGFEVVAAIRADAEYQQLPVIALTAAAQSDMEQKALSCGFDAVLAKPLEQQKLLAALQKALNLDWIVEASLSLSEEAADDEPMQLPDQALILVLREHAEKHNILAIRSVLKELEADGRYQQFHDLVAPLASHYQFVKLVEALDKV
ncbi:MAG: response regulator [Psychrosphaera sp.]|nr:response regulator [Psychrosphaera sp.]